MAGIDELFTKRIPVTIKFPDRENRRASLQISIELHTVSAPVHRKELVVRLTDEADLFFLYCLHLSEEDFQSLKSQQGLLVDFGAFPQKFVDLLELCLQEEHKESPKFILELIANGSGTGCTANLNVIETNPFKHLTHLSLKFLPGTDTDVKKYLAICLKTLKEQNGTLLKRLEQTESDLSQQLRQAREALSTRSQELDGLKSEWTAKTSDITVKHRQEVTTERERALQSQTTTQQRYDREKRELEQAHTKIVKHLETRLYEMEAVNKDLTDRKYKSESSIRELKTKLSTLEEEHHHARQELQSLRKDNTGLDSDYHEQEKVINQLRTRLAVLEQEVKDKEEVQKRTTDLYSTEQQHKRKVEDEIERKKRHINKLESSIKTMSEELVKGNEIIKKLQGEIKNYHTKLKLRTQVTTEQEKLLGEKNKEMEEIRKELEQVKGTLNNRDSENKKLNENLEATMQKLEESRQLLKTNENGSDPRYITLCEIRFKLCTNGSGLIPSLIIYIIEYFQQGDAKNAYISYSYQFINWLNKQVTENQMHRGGLGPGPFEMNSAASVTGSSYRGIHNYSAPSYRSEGPGMSGPPSRLSPSVHTPTIGYQPHSLSGGHSVPGGHNLPQGHGTKHVHYVRPSGSAPLAKSSPIGSIPEERRDPQASPILTGTQTIRTSIADPIIDNKYLQQSDEVPLRSSPYNNTPTGSIHFPSENVGARGPNVAAVGGPSIPSTHNPSRLNKDVIVPRTLQGRPANQQSQAPPLASAYFPNQAKVT